MEFIIEEAVSDYGYSVTRADKMDEPGSITSQIIEKIINSEMVIADSTGHNPNVFYELAVRHASGKPYIQMIKSTESIPFDIADIRTIKYGLDVAEAEKAKEEISAHFESLKNDDPEFDNPISKSAEIQSLRESKDPSDQNLAEILQSVTKLNRKVNRVERSLIESNTQVVIGDDNNDKSTTIVEIGNRRFEFESNSISPKFVQRIANETKKNVEDIEQILLRHDIEVY